jgi:hypothetical protein
MAAETVLMVVVPEAEGLVKPFRDRFDPSAALGAPAHITILYPFLPPERIDDAIYAKLAECCARLPPIDFLLTEARRFDDEVLYLAPEPEEVFRELTLVIWQLFPETPPYAGRHAEIIPHLSVAWAQEAALMTQIAANFTAETLGRLPIAGRATSLALYDNISGGWKQRRVFPFAG